MLRPVAILASAFALAGCSLSPFEMGEQSEQPKPFPTTLGVSIPPSQAMAMMPIGAGQVIAVIERRRGNAIQHDITLTGAPPNFGENQINVTAFRYVDENPAHPVEDKLPMTRLTDEDIYKEMETRIPGGALPTSNAVPRNAQGAFGYAYGRRSGANCLYAWQWIDPPVARQFHPIQNKTTPAPVSVRVRLCRPGMTEEVMVDLVRQLFVNVRYDDGFRGYPGGYAPGPMAGGAGQRRMGGDALSAASGYGRTPMYPSYATGGDYENPRSGYASTYNYPKYANPPLGQSSAVAAAPVRRKVVRRVVRRPAPAADYTFARTLPSAPAPAAAKLGPGGYAAVPMPQ